MPFREDPTKRTHGTHIRKNVIVSWCIRRPLMSIRVLAIASLFCVLASAYVGWSLTCSTMTSSDVVRLVYDTDGSRGVESGNTESTTSIQQQELYILVWNTKNVRWNRIVELPQSKHDVSIRRTSRQRCVFTIDRSRYNDSAGVLFYGDLMHLSRFPEGPRPISQKWIYFSVETPINTVNTGKQLC